MKAYLQRWTNQQVKSSCSVFQLKVYIYFHPFLNSKTLQQPKTNIRQVMENKAFHLHVPSYCWEHLQKQSPKPTETYLELKYNFPIQWKAYNVHCSLQVKLLQNEMELPPMHWCLQCCQKESEVFVWFCFMWISLLKCILKVYVLLNTSVV